MENLNLDFLNEYELDVTNGNLKGLDPLYHNNWIVKKK